MPKIGGILESSLYVEDLDRSLEFYQKIFEFEPINTSGDRMYPINVNDRQVLLLFKKGGSQEPIKTSGGTLPSHDCSGETHLTFSIDAEDLDQWRERLKSYGISIESEITWKAGGISLYFRDPDNHLLEIGTPGIWPIY